MKSLLCILTIFVFLIEYSFAESTSDENRISTPQKNESLIVAGFGDFINQIQKDAGAVLDSTTRRVMGVPDQPKEDIPPPRKEQRNTAPRTANYPIITTHQSYGLNREENRELQQLLIDSGYDPGPADGIPGNKTKIAIKKYQAANNLPINGEPSKYLLTHVRTNRKSAIAKTQPVEANTSVSLKEASNPKAQYSNVNSSNTEYTPFGIPLSKPFLVDDYVEVLGSYNQNGYNIYSVHPKKPHPVFNSYRVWVSNNGTIEMIYVTPGEGRYGMVGKVKVYSNIDACFETSKIIGESLKNKYGGEFEKHPYAGGGSVNYSHSKNQLVISANLKCNSKNATDGYLRFLDKNVRKQHKDKARSIGKKESESMKQHNDVF